MPKGYSAFDGVEDVAPLSRRSADQEGFAYLNEAKQQRVSTVYDDSDDAHGLLDWHHLNRLKKRTILGFNVAPVVDFINPPGMPEREVRKRRAICISAAVAVVMGIIFICVLASQPATQGRGRRQASAAKDDWSRIAVGELCAWQSLYLPDTVVPDAYVLRLEVPLVAPYQLSGHADVALNITNATNCIVLHAAGITITSVAIKDGDTDIAGRVYGDPNAALQQVALQFAGALEPSSGRYVLHLDFQYALQEGMDGLYLSKYTDGTGAESMLVTSQFEVVAARKAFPCFDEPRFKAKFLVQLQIPPAADSHPPVGALANMPKESLDTGDKAGTMLHRFQQTPYMSPHLLGVVVGELAAQPFECVAAGATVPITTWGTFARQAQLKMASELACTALKQMEALTGVAFPLPKLDLVAGPQFASRATANWGLILSDEAGLLVDGDRDDLQQRFDVTANIARQVSRQWFGGLVTCASWSELWLNEGFATYFENAVATAIVPQYQYFDYFYQGVTAKALNDDAVATSHPVTVLQPLTSAGAADNLFDGVTHDKGAAVLRMLRAYLARESSTNPDNATGGVFLSGLRVYLQQKQYSTAASNDLWSSLATVAAGPVDTWMSTWTLRKNYPLVSIKVSPGGHVIVGQDPFTIGTVMDATADPLSQPPPACTNAAPLGAWWIPLSYRFQASPGVRWQPFDTCHSRLHQVLPKGQYVLINPGRYGFYRVNYPVQNWQLLTAAVATLPPSDAGYIADVDFAGLLDDSFHLSEAGDLPISYFLDLAAALPRRLQPDVYSSWAVAKSGLDKITLLLHAGTGIGVPAGCVNQLLAWLRTNVTGPYIAKMQLPNENPGISFEVGTVSTQARRLRALLLSAAAQYGDAGLVARATELLAAAAAGNGASVLKPDMWGAVYRAALAGGSPDVYETLLALYNQATAPTDKRRLLDALATAPTPDLIQRTLELAVSPGVRLSDMGALFESIGSAGGLSFNLTWEYILANTQRILDRYPAGTDAAHSFGRAAKTLASLFVDEAVLARVEAWVDTYQLVLDPGFKGILRENLGQNRRWLDTEGLAVCTWVAPTGELTP